MRKGVKKKGNVLIGAITTDGSNKYAIAALNIYNTYSMQFL